MKNFLKELWSQISIYFFIIFLQIIIFIAIIILFNHLQAPNFLYSYIEMSTLYSIIIVAMLLGLSGGFNAISSKRRLTITLITYSMLLIVPINLYLPVFFNAFKGEFELVLFYILTIYIAEIFPIWICFFVTCYEECKQYDDMGKSIMPLFWSKLVKVILVAVVGYLLIQANLYSNSQKINHNEMSLVQRLQAKDFIIHCLNIFAYLFNSIATLYYPILDMYMYTIKATRKKAEDYEILD